MSLILKSNGGQRALVPFYTVPGLLEEIDTFTREMWDSWKPFMANGSILPKTDIYEEKGELVMKTELPGIGREDLDITLQGDRLIIKAEKKEEAFEEATHHVRERYYGRYYRSVTLPYAVNEGEVSATMEKGVLEIRLPKAEEVKAKRIEIKAKGPKGRRIVKKEK